MANKKSLRRFYFYFILPGPPDPVSDRVFCDDEDDDVDDGQAEDDDVGDVLRVLPEDRLVREKSFVNQPDYEEAQTGHLDNQGGPVRKT